VSDGSISLIWLEIVLGFAAPVGWAVWELIKLRRLRAADAEQDRRAASGTATKP
jgi:hypothetical protein